MAMIVERLAELTGRAGLASGQRRSISPRAGTGPGVDALVAGQVQRDQVAEEHQVEELGELVVPLARTSTMSAITSSQSVLAPVERRRAADLPVVAQKDTSVRTWRVMSPPCPQPASSSWSRPGATAQNAGDLALH